MGSNRDGSSSAGAPPRIRRAIRYARPVPDSKRITLVTNEILGLVRTGGAGTANTFLAFALARRGHRVDVVFTAPEASGDLDPACASEYAERGIDVRMLEPPEEQVRPATLTVTRAVKTALR